MSEVIGTPEQSEQTNLAASPHGSAANRYRYVIAKRIIDIVAAIVLLIILLPLLLGISCTVAFEGPVLFRHKRICRNGREFSCLKFRTMCVGADFKLERHFSADEHARAEWLSTRKLKNDPRVNQVGRLLRTSSLDELPQLINVLRGDMSLVGPRPITREELENIYEPLGAAEAYLSVRPGMTGLWQVSGRNNVSYQNRVSLDIEYVGTMSLGRDFSVLLRTVGVVIACHGAF